MSIRIDVITDSSFKSHTRKAVAAYLARGFRAWRLDAASTRNDDVLFGERDAVIADILEHHELDEFPSGWSLDEVTL